LTAALCVVPSFAQPDFLIGPSSATVEMAADGAMMANSHRYRARMGTSGFRMELPRRTEEDRSPELSLRFAGVTRGGDLLASDTQASPGCSSLVVSYDRSGVIERYHVRDDEIEQTFLIPEPLAGSGDLKILIDVCGNVSAPAWDVPRHGAIDFTLDQRPAIRYGEAYGIDAAGSQVDLKTAWDGEGRIELIVPAKVLDTAAYPFLVDPVVGPSLSITSSYYNDSTPTSAHDPEHDTWLVCWQRNFTTDSDIRCRLFDRTGAPIGPDVGLEINPANDARSPAVAFRRGSGVTVNNRFIVVWADSDDGDATSHIRGRMVNSSTGYAESPAFYVSDQSLDVRDRRPTVAGGVDALVMWDRALPGELFSQSLIIRTVAWPVSPNLPTVGTARTLHSVAYGSLSKARLAQSALTDNTTGVFVSTWRATWTRFWTTPAPGDYDVETASFSTWLNDPSSAFTWMQPPTAVPGGDGVGVNEFASSIAVIAPSATSGSSARYLLAFNKGGSQVLGRMYLTGPPTGGLITIRAAAGERYGEVAVGAGACEFTVAYTKKGTSISEFDFDLYAARVLLDGSVPMDGDLVADPGPVTQNGVGASSRPLLRFGASADRRNTSLLTWGAQTGPAAAGINDVRGQLFEPVAATWYYSGSGCPAPSGIVPGISFANGDPHPGNGQFKILLDSAPPNTLAYLLIGFTPGVVSTSPGCAAGVVGPYMYNAAITDAAGSASVPTAIPCDSAIHGFYAGAVWVILTPGHNPAGFVLSDTLNINWSH